MANELPHYKLRVRELRDAVERLIDGDAPETLFIGRVRLAPQLNRSTGSIDFPEHASIRFHQPVRRAHRLATADGRTSFHFSHRTVVRLRSGSFFDGVLLRPGSAREHCRYVERESAVATIELAPPSAASSLIADLSDNLQAYVETDDDLRPYAHHPAVADRAIFTAEGIYSADLYVAEARSTAHGLRSLPGFDMATEGQQADLLLHGVPGGELERGGAELDRALRGPDDSLDPLAQAAGGRSSGRGARSVAAGHLSYLERDTAVAVQPDGAAAIITNIAESAADRLEFWELVEQEESAPGPDRMTIDIAGDSEFWGRVAGSNQCPVDLRDALQSPDPADRQKFIISSGEDIRAFLSTIPGWQGRRDREEGESREAYRKNGKGLATFHDGRGGRVQYRIIGELPGELSMAGRMRVLRRFGQHFEQRNMPFNAAMHAPDHGNSEHQWHFHLDYYDRPSWRLTAEEVEAKHREGFTPIGVGVGEWSFAAKFRKNGKVSRPFRVKKVEERRAEDWIERLRERLAYVTNEELKREGQYPRYDPRRYDQIGIKAEPGEHLGTKLNAAEGKGDVSERSIANETKQWAAFERELDDQRDAGNQQVAVATQAREQRLAAVDLAAGERAALTDRIAELDVLERSVVDIDHETAAAQHLTARACSRASKVQQVNQRWLDADEAGECDLTPRQRLERTSLRTAASDYLVRLEPLREAAAGIISTCDGVRASALAKKRVLESLIETRLADAEARAARMPAWLAQLDRDRPLITMTRDGYSLSGMHDVEGMAGTDAAQLALADRHARQEREVDALIVELGKGRRDLERRGGRWLFHHRDPAVVVRFGILQDHARIGQAIDRAMSPTGSGYTPTLRPHRQPAARSTPAAAAHSHVPVQPPSRASFAGERLALAATTSQPPTPTVLAATIAPPSVPREQPVHPSMRAVPTTEPVVTPVEADPVMPAPERSRPTPVTNLEAPSVAMPVPPKTAVVPAARCNRIDAMALALKSVKADQRPATDKKASVSHAPQTTSPQTPATVPSSVAPTQPAIPPASAAFRVYSVQRLIADKVVLRLDLNGEIDARSLARRGITIADADRRDPRLVGKAREQRRHAREVVEHFVTRYPGFIVKAGDVCSLSVKTKQDVRAFFDQHDDPWMQMMLRRVFDQHQAAERSRVAKDAATSLPRVEADQVATSPAMTTLERDPAMIAAAQARLREKERDQANAAARLAAAKQPAKDIAPEKSDGPAGPPTVSTPGPKRPPPGWDGGFGR